MLYTQRVKGNFVSFLDQRFKKYLEIPEQCYNNCEHSNAGTQLSCVFMLLVVSPQWTELRNITENISKIAFQHSHRLCIRSLWTTGFLKFCKVCAGELFQTTQTN